MQAGHDLDAPIIPGEAAGAIMSANPSRICARGRGSGCAPSPSWTITSSRQDSSCIARLRSTSG